MENEKAQLTPQLSCLPLYCLYPSLPCPCPCMPPLSKETRKRNLVHYVSIVVPITHQLCLTETDPGHITLEEIYDDNCAVRGVDSDAPLFAHREVMQSVSEVSSVHGHDAKELLTARLSVYNDICNRIVPDSILQQYIHNTLPSADKLFVFKQQFTGQLALSGLLSYLLDIGKRQLYRISLFKQSGRIVNSEFYPSVIHTHKQTHYY